MNYRKTLCFVLLNAVMCCYAKAQTYQYPFQNASLSFEQRVNDLVGRLTLKEKISLMQNSGESVPRLGIPAYNWWNECLHGVARDGIATVFPQAIGMAAMWDTPLMNRIADAISTEARAKHEEHVRKGERSFYQGLTFWTPNINIFRDPRWGREQETYGEDPFLISQTGVALTENEDAVIYYTTDGTEPNTGSLRYDKPFEVTHSMTVKAALALNGSMVKALPAQQSFTLNKATGKPVQYATRNSKYYPANGAATLTDRMRGTTDIGKQWHAFDKNDLVATIDFGQLTSANFVSLGCLQDYGQWIFFPQWVKFEVSTDGKQYTELATVNNTIPATDRAAQTKDFSAKVNAQNFRYLRVTAKNLGQCPKGHPGEGKDAWLFCDEIIVE